MYRLFRILIVFVIVFAIAAPVFAQEATPEPPTAPAPVISNENAFSLINLIAGIAIGAISTGLGAFALIRYIRNDKVILTALEQLGKSFPAETRDLLQRVGLSADDVADIIDEMFDDTPVMEKP